MEVDDGDVVALGPFEGAVLGGDTARVGDIDFVSNVGPNGRLVCGDFRNRTKIRK